MFVVQLFQAKNGILNENDIEACLVLYKILCSFILRVMYIVCMQGKVYVRFPYMA